MSTVKSPGSTRKVRSKLRGSSGGWESGTQGVAVKCVDILKNTGGEGGSPYCKRCALDVGGFTPSVSQLT